MATKAQLWNNIVKIAIVVAISVVTSAITFSYAAGRRAETHDANLRDVAKLEVRTKCAEDEIHKLHLESVRLRSDIVQKISVIETDVKWLRLDREENGS